MKERSAEWRTRNRRKSKSETEFENNPLTNAREKSHFGIVYRLALPLLVLLVAVIGIGGRNPWVLSGCVAIALTGLIINKPPVKRSLFFLWWAGMVFFAWHLFTLAPLPVESLGYPRTEYFEQAYEKIAEFNAINEGLTGYDGQQGHDGVSSFETPHKGETAAKPEDYGRLTLNQAGTRRYIVILAGAWSMFWLSAGMSVSQRMRFMGFLVLSGAVVGALGLFGRYIVSPGDKVWWIFQVDHEVGGGPFINRNHFASFCSLLVPAALSLVLSPVSISGRFRGRILSELSSRKLASYNTERKKERSEQGRKKGRLHYLLRRWRESTLLFRWRFIYGLCLVILISAPILSLSRGGMIMMLIGCFTASLFWVRSKPVLALTGAVIMITVLFSFLLWPSEAVQERISTLRNFHEASPKRFVMSREALAQWRDFPWIGGGADSFRALNGLYRIKPATRSPLYAENEYAQLLADHGLIGAFLMVFLVLALLVGFGSNFYSRFQRTRSLRVLWGTWGKDPEIFQRHRELYEPIIPLPIIASSFGVAAGLFFHFSCDFPARVPLNAFLTGALLGLAMPLPELKLAERGHSWRWPILIFVIVSFFILFAWSGNKLRLDEPSFIKRADMEELTEAIAGAPTYWAPWAKLSQLTREKANDQLYGRDISVTDQFNPYRLDQFGFKCLQIAVEYSPLDPELRRTLALSMMRSGYGTEREINETLQEAALLVPSRISYWREWLNFAFRIRNFSMVKEVGNTATGNADKSVAIRLWREIYNKAQHDYKSVSLEYRALDELLELQPQQSRWHRRMARLETDAGNIENAIAAWKKAAEIEPDNWRHWFELGKLLLEAGQDNAANRAFTKVVKLNPEKRDEVDNFWHETKLDK